MCAINIDRNHFNGPQDGHEQAFTLEDTNMSTNSKYDQYMVVDYQSRRLCILCCASTVRAVEPRTSSMPPFDTGAHD
jgi:hypothetical protein